MKLFLTIPVLNNFRGTVELIESINTVHNIKINIQPQWKRDWCLAAAWNHGVKLGIDWDADYIIVSNDDILFHPQTIDNLVESFHNQADDVILMTASNVLGRIDPEQLSEFAVPEEENLAESPDYSCFMVKPDFLERHGLFDENLKKAYFEDHDSHHRVRLLNYKALTTTRAPYYHFGSVSQKMVPGGVVSSEQFNANRNYLGRKWNTSNPHPDGQSYRTPYNEPNLTPKDWLPGR